MKTKQIKELNIKKVFPTDDDVRNWVFENPEQLENAIETELCHISYNPEPPFRARPDICTVEEETSDRIAVMINIGEIPDWEFIRFLNVAAFTDIKKIVWVVSKFARVNQYILEWLNDRTEGNVEFIVLKLSAYQMPNSKIATKLERMEKIPVPSLYEDIM